MYEAVRILRINEVCARTGLSRSTTYKRIDDSLFPLQVKLGVRAAGWPSHEVDAVVRAMIAGASADEMRKLVARLEAERKQRVAA